MRAMAAGVTRGLVFILDVSPAEERLLWSYWGAVRKAHNWVIGQVKDNLAVRKAERAAGVAEERLTPACVVVGEVVVEAVERGEGG